jgi:hypothetical protein
MMFFVTSTTKKDLSRIKHSRAVGIVQYCSKIVLSKTSDLKISTYPIVFIKGTL